MKLLNKTVKAIYPLEISETASGSRFTLKVSKKDGFKANAVQHNGDNGLIEISAEFAFDYQEDDLYFLNGYQSWTYSPERTRKQIDTSMRFCPKSLDKKFGFSKYGDGHFVEPVSEKAKRKGVKSGYSYAYIRRGETFYLFASLAEHTGFTRIILDPSKNSVLPTKKAPDKRRTLLTVL